MKRKFYPLAAGAIVLLLGTPDSRAEATARELFETLPAQIRAEAEAKRLGKLPQNVGQSDPNYLLSFYRNAREFLENGDENNASQQIRQLENAAGTDPVRDACESVVSKLRKERAERETALAAEISGALQRAGETILKAKTPKDLDGTLRELTTASEKRAASRSAERGNDAFSANTRLQNAIRFVARWQDYLLAANRNDNRQVGEQLRTLSTDVEIFQTLGIPRSELIARLTPPPSPTETPVPTPAARRTVPPAEVNAALEAACDRLKILADLPPVIRDLTALRDEINASSNGFNGNLSELTNFLSALQALQQSFLELQTGVNRGQGPWLNRYENSGGVRSDSRLVGLRAQLIDLSLPRLLGAPDTEKPVEGERVDTFLDRLLAAAKKRADWPAVARGLEARRTLAPNSAYDGGRSEYNNEEGAFKQFFAAQNYEQASQYSHAVASYLSALGTGSQEVPVAVISQRLAAIKKEHPSEYSDGTQVGGPGGLSDLALARRLARLEPAPATTPAVTPAAGSNPTPAATATPVPSATPK